MAAPREPSPAPTSAGRCFDVIVVDVGGIIEVDLAVIDVLARLQLTARRLGCQIRLRHASPELLELLALAGLCDVVPLSPGSPVEPGRQTEQREQAGGVEERVEPSDPAV